MARFTAIHLDSEADLFYRVTISSRSADDVELEIRQFLYEKAMKGGELSKEDFTDLTSFGETLFVCAGDLPNLITPDTEVESLEIPDDWEPQDDTPTE